MSALGHTEIKAKARAALFAGQFLRYVVAYFLLTMVTLIAISTLAGILSVGIAASGIAPFFSPGGQPEIGLFLDPEVMMPLMGSILVFSLLVIYPIGFATWGKAAMSIATMRRGLTIGHAFSGWGHGWKMGWIIMVKMTYLSLWSLLVIPGIVKSFSYAMTDLIAVDHPDWSANQCITESRRLMNGNKLRYLVLILSLIGWVFLLVVASWIPLCGNVLQFFILPYMDTSKASFYENLLDCDEQRRDDTASAEISDYVGVFEKENLKN